MLRPPSEYPNGLEPPGGVSGPELLSNVIYFSHVNKRTTYDRPGTSSAPPPPIRPLSYPSNGGSILSSPGRQSRRDGHHFPQNTRNPLFTTDPSQLRGEIFRTTIVKGTKGLGFTLIGNDSSSKGDEFIQVKSVLPGGAAAANGVLAPGDVLVRVNHDCLLGASQADACRIFVSIPVGEPVDIEVCRGYPLVIDPSNRIITESVYDTRQKDYFEIEIAKGAEGFGFTIADSVSGQRVKKILYPSQCPNLLEGDVICELDGRDVRGVTHTQLVDMLRECPIGYRGRLTVKRNSPKQRSRTPLAAFRYGGEQATPAPMGAPRSKTPAPSIRDTPTSMMGPGSMRANTIARHPMPPSAYQDDNRMRPSSSTLGFSTTPNYMPLSALQSSSNLITVNLIRKPQGFGFRLLGGRETGTQLSVGQIVSGGAAADDGRLREGDEILEIDGVRVEGSSHGEAVALLEKAAHQKHVKMIVRRPSQQGVDVPRASMTAPPSLQTGISQEYDVVLQRSENEGFGFVIISSVNRQGSTIGQLIEGSPAARSGRLTIGDRVTRVNGCDIAGMTHAEIVGLIKASGLTVCLTISPDSAGASPAATSYVGSTYAPSYSHLTPIYGGYGSVSQAAPSYSTSLPPPPPLSAGLHKPNGYGNYETYNGREITPDQDDVISVELERGVRGFGFSIRGGHEFGAMPLFVLRIAEDGAAAADGRLRVGDQLIEINGNETRGLTHEQAIALIKQHPTVRIKIRRHRLP